MIVDSSAVVAIVLQEPGYPTLVDELDAATNPGIGAPTLVETGIVLTARLGPMGKTILARLVDEIGLDIVPFQKEHWQQAVDAFLRFGKGRHPAKLNFGDCLSYATARLAGEPLLCIGDDFAKTDLDLVLA